MPTKDAERVEEGVLQYAKAWGENPVPAALTATLITAQHIRPIAYLPLLFPPVFLFSSYLNVNGYKTDSAGITAAWSGAYLLLARRRKQGFGNKFGARGLIRGGTMGLCLFNLAGGGLAYAFGGKKLDV